MVLFYLNTFDLQKIDNREATKLFLKWSPKFKTTLSIWESKPRSKQKVLNRIVQKTENKAE